MEKALHLLRIVSLLYNIGHLINASIEVIGYVQHLHSNKMRKQLDVVGVKVEEPSFIGKIFHYNIHHSYIPLKQERKRKNGFTVVFVARL